jgi:hypothetical protein
LSEGTDNGDGCWTVETSNIAGLTITSPTDYAGALVLNVIQSWTNADGSTGATVLADNVEVYAPGTPIFAWSGNDVLTGSTGSDLFVFAQPIGNDIVYNFDVAHDQIDLIGFGGLASFADIQAHLANDAGGDAVITTDDGKTITLWGVDAGTLNAGDFVFDQVPTFANSASITVGDGAMLPLSGIVDNTGTIALESTGDTTELQLIQHGLTLQGGGHLTLSDNSMNIVVGTDPSVTLTNVDNTISGAGRLGDGQMTLINHGTIDANGSNALVIDTGANVVVNDGILEASGSGGLVVHGDVANDGLLWANGGNIGIDGNVSGNGSALIDGTASIALGGMFDESIVLNVDAAGTLNLAHSVNFGGLISGFNGNDTLDLADVAAGQATLSYTANQAGTGGLLTVSDGTDTAHIAFVGQYTAANFHVATDALGGTLLTYTPEG